jgi:hypothetical protein
MHSGAFGNAGYGGDDVIEVEFLSGGVVKVSTDPISGANHASADGLIDAIQRAAGGEATYEQKHSELHHQQHQHDEGHQHNYG